jgi:hypothetical protein
MRGIISWFVLFHSLPHPLFLLLLTFPLSSDCRMFLSPLSLRFQKGNAMQRTSIGQLPISSGTSLIFSSPFHPLVPSHPSVDTPSSPILSQSHHFNTQAPFLPSSPPLEWWISPLVTTIFISRTSILCQFPLSSLPLPRCPLCLSSTTHLLIFSCYRFPASQVLVLFQEHMNSNTLATLRKIESFLGIPMNDYQSKPIPLSHLYSPFLSSLQWIAGSRHAMAIMFDYPPFSLLPRPLIRPQGLSYVWKDYWKSSYTTSSPPTPLSEGSNDEVTVTPGGLLSSTKTLLDEYYRPHNTNLRALLESHGAISPEFPFPSSWPTTD